MIGLLSCFLVTGLNCISVEAQDFSKSIIPTILKVHFLQGFSSWKMFHEMNSEFFTLRPVSGSTTIKGQISAHVILFQRLIVTHYFKNLMQGVSCVSLLCALLCLHGICFWLARLLKHFPFRHIRDFSLSLLMHKVVFLVAINSQQCRCLNWQFCPVKNLLCSCTKT